MMNDHSLNSWKAHFPIFSGESKLVYLDSAATSQRPHVVLDSLQRFYRYLNSNAHRALYPMGEKSTAAYEEARETVRRFVGARLDREIIFTGGTTESINLVARCWAMKYLKEGDEIVLTEMEHHSNWVPWQQVAERVGAVLKFVPVMEDGELDYGLMGDLISNRTKLVAVTGLSNTLGTLVDLKRVVDLAKLVQAKVLVDAAQLVAHQAIDVQHLNVDFLAFSGHKIYGPMGVGVLYAKEQLLEEMDPWLFGGGMIREVKKETSTWNDLPWKFEAGTPRVAQAVALGTALNFVSDIGMSTIESHDRGLMIYALERLGEIEKVSVLGLKDPKRHIGALSFVIDKIHPHDVASILGEEGICVRAGHHCTMPLMKSLKVNATTRASFGIYNTKADIDLLAEGLEQVIEKLG